MTRAAPKDGEFDALESGILQALSASVAEIRGAVARVSEFLLAGVHIARRQSGVCHRSTHEGT
jgi:hypothetical protein